MEARRRRIGAGERNTDMEIEKGTEVCLEKLGQADMILAGLGEEFDGGEALGRSSEYQNGQETLKKAGLGWLVPAWKEYCRGRLSGLEGGDTPEAYALRKLAGLLEGKNYFVVSVSTNSQIARTPWREGRLVMPCGSILRKQCILGDGELEELSREDGEKLNRAMEELYQGHFSPEVKSFLGQCPRCGSSLVLNNVYGEEYDEKGYLDQWHMYTKWLQGTLNRKLLVLELGVGMRFPSVVRWPFEKAAFLNQKAFFARVNEELYQLDENLSGKGCGIPQNAVDWLCRL